MVPISNALAEFFHQRGLVPSGARVIVAPDACDPLPKNEAMASPPHRSMGDRSLVHIGYVGQLFSGKGGLRLVEMARQLPASRFHLIGGEETKLRQLRTEALPQNLVLHGFVAPSNLPAYYHYLDILLMPYRRRVAGASGRTDLSPWMSPMKMFEYMAAGKAIVASDLPVLREVLADGRNSLLVPAEDDDAWVDALRRLATDVDLRRCLGQTAQEDFLGRYTWDARAKAIMLS
jgi:glycosyltransferase involved in cell wall biosynthesis